MGFNWVQLNYNLFTGSQPQIYNGEASAFLALTAIFPHWITIDTQLISGIIQKEAGRKMYPIQSFLHNSDITEQVRKVNDAERIWNLRNEPWQMLEK